MTQHRDFDRLARAWLDLMPDEAPDRVIADVLQAVETTPQVRRPLGVAIRRPFQMTRFSLAALALAIVVLAGGAVVLTRLTAPPIGAASPTSGSSVLASTGPTAPTGEVPSALRGSWFGATRPLGGLLPGAGTVLQIAAGSVAVTQSSNQLFKLIDLPAAGDGGRIRVETSSGPSDGCQPGQVGVYAYALSASGQTLTISADQEACSQREAVLDGTWWLIDCHIPNSATCLGQMDAGHYASQYFASIATDRKPWVPHYGSLTFTVPDGWASSADWPNLFSLALASDYAAAAPNTDPAAEISVVSNVVAESQATPCSGKPDPAVAHGAAAYVAWLRTVPGLAVGTVSTISIAGHKALSVDLSVPRPPSALCDGTDAVIEYLLSAGWPTATGSTGNQTHAIAPGNHDRLILLDVPSGYLDAILITTDDGSRFDAFAQEAMPIIDSFQFTDAFPTP